VQQLNDFITRYRNAKKAIQQIKNGEWEPIYNSLAKAHLTAVKGELELWLSNGSFFCEIEGGSPYFGLFWRHWVYFAASRKLKKDADRKMKEVRVQPKL
jgi:hypothetical protein